jgi:predicted dehydrogenase
MFTDERVDIIYITSPHNTHYAFMKKALENGKHLLVEKSITLNSQELEEMAALAESKNLVLAEAMTIWHMPLYKELWRIVGSGELGRVQMFTVNFGSFKEYNMENRFFNRNLAGGAMLDIGVYALSIVRSFMEEQPDRVVSNAISTCRLNRAPSNNTRNPASIKEIVHFRSMQSAGTNLKSL